jgi:PleD family two-component response regulator
MRSSPMFERSAVSLPSSGMTKSRQPHPIVQVAYKAATELNDLLNAIGLRISLLRHQLAPSANEAEMIRLAGLVEKATQRVQQLEEYARAEALVASMRPGRMKRSERMAGMTGLAEPRERTALLITDATAENNSIKEGLEQSGFKVVVAESSTNALKLLQASDDFDHIVCDSSILAEAGWNFTSELSRSAPASRVYVLHRRDRDRILPSA